MISEEELARREMKIVSRMFKFNELTGFEHMGKDELGMFVLGFGTKKSHNDKFIYHLVFETRKEMAKFINDLTSCGEARASFYQSEEMAKFIAEANLSEL